jgi:hypothetical protein
VKPAYFVVARRQEARLLTPPHHGGAAIRIDCSARLRSLRRMARSALIAPWSPPTSSSLADKKRVCSLLLSTAEALSDKRLGLIDELAGGDRRRTGRKHAIA